MITIPIAIFVLLIVMAVPCALCVTVLLICLLIGLCNTVADYREARRMR